MSEPRGKGVSCFYRLWQWLRNQIAQSVPEDYQFCEFECRESQCTMDDWEKCDKRLRYKA